MARYVPLLNLSAPKSRDKRRSFTKTQQTEILQQQKGKCAICHKSLDFRAIDYDHKKPWAAEGRTITENGRALHPNCHAIVTHDARLRKVEPKRKQRKKHKTTKKQKRKLQYHYDMLGNRQPGSDPWRNFR